MSTLRNWMEATVHLLPVTPQTAHETIVATLLSDGCPAELADALLDDIPSAYARIVFSALGAPQPIEHEGGSSTPADMSSYWHWRENMAFVNEESARGLSRDQLFAIAGLSAEIDALGSFLQSGGDPKDAVVATTRMQPRPAWLRGNASDELPLR